MAVGLGNKSHTSRSLPSWNIIQLSGRRTAEQLEYVSVVWRHAPCNGSDDVAVVSFKEVLLVIVVVVVIVGVVASRRPIRTVRLSGSTQSWTSGRLAFLSDASCGCCKTTQWTAQSWRRVAGRALQMQADGVGRWQPAQIARDGRLGEEVAIVLVVC
jgi:hypothetical protein